MEPFRIQCETCRSRLKIRSPEVIGEIHACPKCGSMVHIQPPPDWTPGTQSQTSSLAALTASSATTESLIIPASASAELPVGIDLSTNPAVATPVLAEAAPMGVNRLWFVWAAAAIAAVVVGGVTMAVWGSRGDKTESSPGASTPVVKSVEPLKPSPAAVTEQTKVRADDPYRVEHSKPKPANDTVHAPAKPTDVAATQPDASSVPLPKPARPTRAEPPKQVAVAKPETGAVASSAPANRAEPLAKAEQAPVLKFDPLTFDPDHLGSTAGSFADIKPLAGSVPSELPAARANDQANDPAAPTDVPAVAAPAVVAPPRVRAAVTAERGQPGSGPQQAAGQQLAAPVKSLTVDAIPLSRLVVMLSDFAGAGVTLDPTALELAGVAPRTPFSVNAEDSTVEAVLRKALAEHHLDIAVRGGRARVVLAKTDERRTIDCDVKGLAAGADAASIAQVIQHFIAPKTWKASGGAGTIVVDGTTLHVEQSEAVRREVLIFLERLRMARGLALRTKYPAALLAVESSYAKLSAKLGEHTTFTFMAWTRLGDVLRQLEELSGLTILVDWSALADTELSPSSPVACSANDRSWQESLDGVLEPLGLGWWAVNGETIQITSLASLEQIERLEFHEVPPKFRSQFASNQALVDALQEHVVKAAGKQAKAGQPRIEVDEPSSRLIVLASPAVHRAIAQKLASVK